MDDLAKAPKPKKPIWRGLFTATVIAGPFFTALVAWLAGTTINFLPQAPIFQIDVRNLTTPTAPRISLHQFTNDNHLANLANCTRLIEEHHHTFDADPGDRDVVPPASQPSVPPEFYNVYLWSFCTGAYGPVPDAATSVPVTRPGAGVFALHYSLNWCSPTTVSYSYNTVSALQPRLPASIDLPDYVVPDKLTRVIYVCGIITHVFAGIAVFLSVCWAFADKSFLRHTICGCVWISALSILVMSSCATYLITTSVGKWNAIGPQTGVAAFTGGVFVTMIWCSFGAFVLFNLLFTWRWVHVRKAAKADADLGLEMPLVQNGGPPGMPPGPWGAPPGPYSVPGAYPPVAGGIPGATAAVRMV